MTARIKMKFYILLTLVIVCSSGISQTVPLGIHYQAVARDNYGKELSDRDIDVRFSVISGNPLGTVVYQELHQNVKTSKYGVFSLVIGKGTPTGETVGGLSNVDWGQANHFLKVEVKFDNDFIDMGTMQFLAVPYALYAQKSLEPGPQGPKGEQGIQGIQGIQGPKGDQGDPATDDQTLSFNGTNLSISGGNTVNLGSLNQALSLKGDTLGITGGNYVMLTNQIQDLQLDVNNKLKITKNSAATEIDLSKYIDNTDNQQLNFNNSNNNLSITGGNTIDLTPVKQDLLLNNDTLSITNKINPSKINLRKYLDNTDNQVLSYNPEDFQLSLTNGGAIPIGSIIAFRAGITASYNMPNNTPVDLIFDQITGSYYNDGGNYNPGSGTFQAPYNGIYSFSISINLPSGNSSVIIKLTGVNYETIIGPTASSGYFRSNITMKLNKSDIVNVAIVQNNGFPINPYIISGSFSGFRIY